MPIVVADAGPLHYLILIDAIDLLPRLFGKIRIPDFVSAELNDPRTPGIVRDFVTNSPPWMESMPTHPINTLPFPKLGDGERAAIALAYSAHAKLILMDDRAGVTSARAEGFIVMGTLGVLDLAARRGMIDLADAFARLKRTNFRCAHNLMNDLVDRFEADRTAP